MISARRTVSRSAAIILVSAITVASIAHVHVAQAAEGILDLKQIERGLSSSRTSFQRQTFARDTVEGAVGRIESEVVDVAANGDISAITPAGIRIDCRVGLSNLRDGEKALDAREQDRNRAIKELLSKVNIGDSVVLSGKMAASFISEAPAEGGATPPAQGRLGQALLTLEPCDVVRKP